MELQVQSIHFDADVKLLDYLEKKVAKLETFFDKIISADVTLRLEKTGQVQDKILELKLNVPGNTLVVKETCKSFEEAIDLGTETLKRQLIKHKEKLQAK
jgi:putative sigma-54 modulation protein